MDLTELFNSPFALGIAAVAATVVLWRQDRQRTKEQFDYAEARRADEREARLKAEDRMDEALAVAKQATDLSARYERAVREKGL